MSYTVIEGNLAADPETAVAESGTTWSRFRVITNDRYKDRDGDWTDGPAISYQITAFRRLAENVTDTLLKGHRVIVTGPLTVKSYRDSDGNERVSREIIADHIGVSLARATATVTKNPRAAGSDTEPEPAEGAEPAF